MRMTYETYYEMEQRLKRNGGDYQADGEGGFFCYLGDENVNHYIHVIPYGEQWRIMYYDDGRFEHGRKMFRSADNSTVTETWEWLTNYFYVDKEEES